MNVVSLLTGTPVALSAATGAARQVSDQAVSFIAMLASAARQQTSEAGPLRCLLATDRPAPTDRSGPRGSVPTAPDPAALRLLRDRLLRTLAVADIRGALPLRLRIGPDGKTLVAGNHAEGQAVEQAIAQDTQLGTRLRKLWADYLRSSRTNDGPVRQLTGAGPATPGATGPVSDQSADPRPWLELTIA